jgi:hypothetical protein
MFTVGVSASMAAAHDATIRRAQLDDYAHVCECEQAFLQDDLRRARGSRSAAKARATSGRTSCSCRRRIHRRQRVSSPAACISRIRPPTKRWSSASTPPASPPAAASTVSLARDPTIRATTRRSCSTPPATTSKPCTTAPPNVPSRRSRSCSDCATAAPVARWHGLRVFQTKAAAPGWVKSRIVPTSMPRNRAVARSDALT